MRHLAIVLVIVTVCCSCQTTQTLNPNYQSYLSAMTDRPPLLDLTLHPDGRIKSITVGHVPNIAPYKVSYHPAWGIFGRALTVVGGIMAGGWAMDQVLGNFNTGAINTIGSYNSAGKGFDYNLDYSNPVVHDSFNSWNFPTTENP